MSSRDAHEAEAVIDRKPRRLGAAAARRDFPPRAIGDRRHAARLGGPRLSRVGFSARRSGAILSLETHAPEPGI